jgi:hypothetical protein
VGAPVGALAGAAGGGGGHHGHAGAVDGQVELVRSLGAVGRGGQHGHGAARDRGSFGGDALRDGSAVGFGTAFDAFVGQLDSGQLGEQASSGGERLGRGSAGHHLSQSRRQRRVRDAEVVVAGHDPAMALRAVIVGAAQRDRPEHGVEVLVAVADELGAMALPAVDSRPAVPGLGGQQLPQQ